MTKTKKITYLAVLSALVIVLQCISTVLGATWKVVPTLALIPIILGAIILGVWQGAFLGFVFSTVVFIFGISGYDAFTYAMIQYNPVLTIFLIYFKGCLAAFVAGLVYKFTKNKLPKASVWFASALCPIINTLTFCLALFLYVPFINDLGLDGNLMYTVFITFAGVNFLIEFALNLILTPAVITVRNVFNKVLKGE